MNLLSWNCRGLGNLRTVRDLCRLVKDKCPTMVFLMETKLWVARIESIKAHMGFDSVFVVDSKGRSGGLALFWKSVCHVTIQNFSLRHINAKLYSEEFDFHWIFTGFYGNPEVCKRRESWALLQHLASFPTNAWLCCGDFNEILVDAEKQEGARPSWAQMEAFRNTLEFCQLNDMGFIGSRFTWSNKQSDICFMKERLDRVVANIGFASKFPQFSVEVLAARTSDHTPLFLSTHGGNARQRFRPRQFRYEAWWQKKQGFSQIVKQVWKEKISRVDCWGALKRKIVNSQFACLQWRKCVVDPSEKLIGQKMK
jgi:exonuclease III